VILAEDEASLYLQATLMRVWALQGQTPAIWSDPSRKKVCFYGTLNLLTGQVVVTRTETMNSAATAQHLQAVLATYPDAPLLLLWDRAKWHGGEAVRQVLADHPRLEVMKLPVAAPDLNPQEQVWKATRRAVSHNHQIVKLPALADDFERHLQETTFPTSTLEFHGYHAIRPMFE
jgi:putative transposase